MFDLSAIQEALRASKLDGWLLYDFRGSNVLTRRILDLESRPVNSRRFFYYVPASGPPRKIVHKIEPAALDHLPGEATVYLRWQELESAIADVVAGAKRVAMEYAPGVSNPYISRVDAGTVEAVRACGPEVVSSGDLIQRFEATWDAGQWRLHLEADGQTRAAFEMVWKLIADRVRSGDRISECEVQAAIMDHFARNGMTTYSPPIVGVGPHGGDPHFENTPENDTPIRKGDYLLVDLWAKMDRPRGVYSDLTRMAYVGEEVPARYAEVFDVVARARDAAIASVRDAFAAGRPIRGFEVDNTCRAVIEDAGYGDFFIHRTGHNIGQETHGNGANIDGLETQDERLLMPRTCFSIEPGIYLPEFGARSEVDVYIDEDGAVHVTGGPPQERVVALLAEY